jgi:hypothetical protein
MTKIDLLLSFQLTLLRSPWFGKIDYGTQNKLLTFPAYLYYWCIAKIYNIQYRFLKLQAMLNHQYKLVLARFGEEILQIVWMIHMTS